MTTVFLLLANSVGCAETYPLGVFMSQADAGTALLELNDILSEDTGFGGCVVEVPHYANLAAWAGNVQRLGDLEERL